MASRLSNLSSYDPTTMPNVSVVQEQNYAIVVADWNDNVTYPLMEGAYQALQDNGVKNVDVFHVPGAFELTNAASRLQDIEKYNAIIVLGCVIQGDTPHFDYVCGGVTQGVTILNTRRGMAPVVFGLLTVNNLQQAIDRAGGELGNKGVEGAITAIKMANLNLS